MKNGTLKRSIALYPEVGLCQWIEEMRYKYDPLATKISAHITLVFPFISMVSRSDLEDHVRTSLSNIHEFNCVINDVNVVDDNAVWLLIDEGSKICRQLHDALYGGILKPYLSKEHTYTPHITIGSGLSNDTAQQLRHKILGYLPCEVPVRSLAVEVIDQDELGTIELSILLPKSS